MKTGPVGGRLPAKPGAALKAIRAKLGLTLADVSERTGLTISALSKVENGKIALSYDKLVRLSEGLKIDISQLFGPDMATQPSHQGSMRRSITRSGEGRSIDVTRGQYLYLAGDLLNKRFTPILGEVWTKNISDYPKLIRHGGDEFVFVVEGILELHTEMYTPARLEVGDSVYFDSGMGHAYVAVGEGPCRILSICATPEHELIEIQQAEVQMSEPAKPEALSPEHSLSLAGAQPARKVARAKKARG